jgi:peptidoglycan LD-endopeptidase LytH
VITRLALAWLHLLALVVGLAGVWARGRALSDSLRHPEDPRAIRRALVGDTWWGLAAAVWIVTGLWRLLMGTEKSTSYYVASHAFMLKMSLFLVVFALEIWPMTTLMRWRRKKAQPDPRDVGRIEIISYVQCVLVAIIALVAVAMARGYGAGLVAPPAPVVSAASGAVDSVLRVADSTSRAPVVVRATTPPPPSGTDSVTPDDVALITREIAMPLDSIDPTTLHSSFTDARGGGTREHHALDIMSPRGTPVRSAASGRVLKLFTSKDGGLMVYAADSSERFVLMYAHLDRYAPALTDSTRLVRGQLIGFVGSTGNASERAPHLHFAIARSADVKHWSRGNPIDPLPILVAARVRMVSRR